MTTFKAHRTIDLDERDTEILARRQAAFTAAAERGVQQGEVVIFADGVKGYVSHVWKPFIGPHREDYKPFHGSVQTSDGGSFYLGDGYVSFSGSLYDGVPPATLTDTGRTETISAWFFHHDWHAAHNGIDVPLDVRVWTCTRRSDER